MIVALMIILVLWLGFNLIAPYAVLLRAEPISWGRLPAELLTQEQDKKVKFYITTLRTSFGYSVWAPPALNIIIFDRLFFAKAHPHLLRFVIAHEMAHFHQHHHQKRWLSVVTGLVLIPGVRRWLAKMEDDADFEASTRTGFNRNVFPELGGHND